MMTAGLAASEEGQANANNSAVMEDHCYAWDSTDVVLLRSGD